MHDLPARNASIDLNQLDWEDERFEIKSFVSSQELEASLERCGLLFSPWLWEKNRGEYVIVDGFKRLKWLKNKGEGDVECLVFQKDSDPLRLLLQRIEGKLSGPPLNPAEKARIVAMLEPSIPREEILRVFLPALGIPSRPDAVKKQLLLAASSERLLGAVASGEIVDRAAIELVSWEEEQEAREEAVAILRLLRCSASIQMEILERATEIARGRDKGRVEILRDPEIQSICAQPRMNHREKTQAVRDLLNRMRFPRLKAREERFRRDIEAASLPEAMRLDPPPSFEGERWRLQLAFSDPEELRALLDQAQAFAVSQSLKDIMER